MIDRMRVTDKKSVSYPLARKYAFPYQSDGGLYGAGPLLMPALRTHYRFARDAASVGSQNAVRGCGGKKGFSRSQTGKFPSISWTKRGRDYSR